MPPLQSNSHPPPLTLDKLDLPGAGKVGPGPPSPRGIGPPSPRAIDSGQPSPRSQGLAQPPFTEKTLSNHIGNSGNVINKPSVPNTSVDVRNNFTASPVNPTPAPAKTSLNQPPQPVQNSMTLRAPPSRPQPQRFSPPLPSEPVRQNMTNKSDISPRVSTISAPMLAAPTMRLEPEVPSFPDPSVLRQPNTLQISEQISRGRTPTRQERSRMGAQNDIGASQAGGGYNFQKIMDDRFEHYKRPPSRERSADRYGLGSRQGSRQQLSRDVSRDRINRPQSRQRTPMNPEQGLSENKTSSGLDSLNLDAIVSHPTGNGAVGGGLSDLKLPVEDQLRFRGVHQEIPHFGAPPKRTESLYMKPVESQQATYKVNSFNFIKRVSSIVITKIICYHPSI